MGRKRKEEENEEQNQEFDDNQTDPYHGEDKSFPEPEALDLPESMDLDDTEQEDNFEENGTNEPEIMPDFEEEDDNQPNEGNEDDGKTDVEKFDEDDSPNGNEGEDKSVIEDSDSDNEEEKVDEANDIERAQDSEAGMDIDENNGHELLESNQELDQDKKNQGSEGVNEDKSSQPSSDKSFGVKKIEEEAVSGAGTTVDQEKSLTETPEKVERLDIVDGDATGQDNQGIASIYRHVMDQRADDRNALDKDDDKEVKEQILPTDWDTKKEEKEVDIIPKIEDDNSDNSKCNDKPKKDVVEKMETDEDNGAKINTPGEFTPTFHVSRGSDSLIGTQELAAVNRVRPEIDSSCSLEVAPLIDGSTSQLPIMTQLSHQLCEQLRLILEPTEASKLQGDFRTGKRLNMRKIIPYIASQFKKDKIWLRRVKPNKREFQILVALD